MVHPERQPEVQSSETMSLESLLWREVSQHLELEESAPRIFEILSEHLPLVGAVFRRLELGPTAARVSILSIVGENAFDSRYSWINKAELTGDLAHELEEIATQNSPRFLRGPLATRLTAEDYRGLVLVLPLRAKGKPAGLIALVLGDAPPEIRYIEVLRPALLPLSIAFENDQRIQELARMREALEADKSALLSRLGRQEISEVVIGESGGLATVMERVEQVAKTDAPVLVLGETGSGKEVVARAIHARSRRARGPIVRINCGAIPSELIDSELFGHERGSFTGAVATRKGWFERADGGTLFLDEVGELPLAAQVRLLRVLQDGTLERVGSQQTLHVDVRIVAATHRHLETMVDGGGFREDLWYRLSVFPIRLPSLRERPEDLPLLAQYFADRTGKRLGGSSLTLSSADLETLSQYPWPGNVRELAAVIERAAILGGGRRLDLSNALGQSQSTASRPPPMSNPERETSSLRAGAPSSPSASGKITTLDQAMAEHIRRALESCGGRIEGPHGAAQVLDINPHTLRARMRKLGVEWSQFRNGVRPRA